jgi:predicted ATPase
MVEAMTRNSPFPRRLTNQIVARADGVPLFVEELTKMVLETDWSRESAEVSPSEADLAIPATLRDSLTARLDQLGEAKVAAQLAATLGREFSYELLHAAWSRAEADLQEALKRLVRAEHLYQRGLPPRSTYVFKHALIQEVAYQSILKKRRREFHAKIARALEEQFPESVASAPEEVARHFEGAGELERSISYYQLAGELACERWAHSEAIGHLTRGVELLQALPEGPARKQREALLQFSIAAPLMASKGNAHPEVERAFGRARELCQQIGETPGLSKALFGLFTFYLARGQMRTAYGLGDQLLGLSERDPDLLVWGRLATGVPLYFLGKPSEAVDLLDKASEAHDSLGRRDLAPEFGQDPQGFSQCYAALSLWHLGHPDQAIQKSQESIETARRDCGPLDLAFALGLGAALDHMRRDPAGAGQRGQEAMTVSAEHNLPLWLGMGTVFYGWALVEEKDAARGIEEVQRGLEQLAATATQAGAQQILSVAADCYRSAGLADEALGCLELAFALPGKDESPYWDAELHRIRAELLLERGAPAEEVEEELRLAIGLARGQHAKSLELRAATSLARSWVHQGKRHKARDLLTPVYEWFTEGFDTQDLKDAKALLEDLE